MPRLVTLLGHAHTPVLSKGSALDVPAPTLVWGGLDTPLAEKLGGKKPAQHPPL